MQHYAVMEIKADLPLFDQCVNSTMTCEGEEEEKDEQYRNFTQL